MGITLYNRAHKIPIEEAIRTGQRRRYGELVVYPNAIYSYDAVIAVLDREHHTAKVCIKRYSNTTTRHQCTVSTALRVEGWDITETVEELEDWGAITKCL